MASKKNRKTSRRKKRSKGGVRKKDRSVQYFIVWGMIVAYVVVFSYLSILRYESYQTSAYDLGTMIQVIWNTSRGWILQDSINMGYPMTRFWMAHWEFIFILIAFIYRIFSHAYTILILQTAVVALGALPLYWLGKKIVHDKATAATFSFAYLMYPAIQNANLADVHGVTFAASLLIFTFYFLIKQNIKLFYVFAVLALMCREDSALILIMMGLYSIFVLKQTKHGLIIATVCVVWFAIWLFRLKIRAILGLPEFDIMAGADTHWSHLRQLSHDPLYLFKFLAKKYNILYFVFLFAPILFLSFFEWKVLFIAAPIFAINLLSSYFYTHDVEHYYSATITPFVFISAIYGMEKVYQFFRRKLGHRYKERAIRENVLSILSTLMLVLAVVFFFIKSNALDFRFWKITDHHRVLNRIIKTIPEQSSLSAEHRLIPQAAKRHELYVFNDNVGKVEYILWDFYAPSTRLVTRSSFHLPYVWPNNDTIRAVLKNRDYGVVEYDDGVCLLQKGADYEAGLKNLATDVGAAIENFLKKPVTEMIDFMGHNDFPLLSAYYPVPNSEAIRWKYAVHFTTFWSARDSIDQDYQVIFKYQVGDTAYYQKHQPVFGVFPTSRWQPNDIIKDEVFWELPDSAVSGTYQIFASFAAKDEVNLEQAAFVKLFDLPVNIPEEK